jgi:predicted ATPase
VQKFPIVTLFGTGGAGKTRCAIQIGADLLDGTGDGVWLAELSSISDQALVPSVLAQAMNVQVHPEKPMLDAILAYLKRRRLLLILDSCEHVIEEVRRVVAAIVHGCPNVRILATSRQALSISGEQIYRMPSLSVPPAGSAPPAHEALAFGALQLFADRAFSADNRFVLNEENTKHVAEICRRLDGIPLAIELAAARIKVLAPQQLAQKLSERFRVLTGGDRSALPRHQTMRALIDWSYDLLSEEERRLLRKLSIFAGGFTLEGAAAVCSSDGIDELATLDLVSSLVDKSLVQMDPIGTTRQYAREKLLEGGEYEGAASAHAAACVSLYEELDVAYEATPDRAWYARAEPELENLRAALGWAFGARGDVRVGQRLAGTLYTLWVNVGTAEGRRWVQTALATLDADTPAETIAALDLAEANFDASLTQHKAALVAGERALERYRKIGNTLAVAYAEQRVGNALLYLGRIEEGEAFLTSALATARTLGARKLTSNALRSMADARDVAGDIDAARPLYAESLAIARGIGAERRAAAVAVSLAEAEFRAGNFADALQLANEALAAYRTLNDINSAALVLWNTAAYLIALGRYDEGRNVARESLSAARDAQLEVGTTFAVQHLAAICASNLRPDSDRSDRMSRAARLLGFVDGRLAALEALREYTEQQEYDKTLSALIDALGPTECARFMGEGSAWSEDHAVSEALLV